MYRPNRLLVRFLTYSLWEKAYEDIGRKLEYENVAHMKTQLRARVLKLEKKLEALGKEI